MSKKTVVLSVRVDEDVKQETEEVLNQMGMTFSTAVNLFFRQVVLKKGIPFEINIRKDEEDNE